MSTTIALRRERRPLGATRYWAGPSSVTQGRVLAPKVRRLVRTAGDASSIREVAKPGLSQRPMVVVLRLWMGVLSMFMLIVSLGLVGMTLGAWVLGYRPVVVTTGSMEPSIRPGDVVITRKVKPRESLGSQSVINFLDPNGAGYRLHRIVEVDRNGYRTKGDANPTTDSAEVPPQNVKGVGLVLAPFAGFLPLWIDQGRWLNVGLGLVGLVAVGSMSRRSWMWPETAAPKRAKRHTRRAPRPLLAGVAA